MIVEFHRMSHQLRYFKSLKKNIQGVKKAQLLCIARKIPETFMNIAALLSVLRLEDIKFAIATDFKLLNMLLGLSVCYDDKIPFGFQFYAQ